MKLSTYTLNQGLTVITSRLLSLL